VDKNVNKQNGDDTNSNTIQSQLSILTKAVAAILPVVQRLGSNMDYGNNNSVEPQAGSSSAGENFEDIISEEGELLDDVTHDTGDSPDTDFDHADLFLQSLANSKKSQEPCSTLGPD
jgi:uncharacterized cupredoxin-like copper-binding protein